MRKRIGIDFPVAILAFLIALLLWFHVVTEKEYVQQVDVPLRIENEPPELVLLTTPPPAVRIKVRGTGKDLLSYNLGQEDRFCRLDASGASRGDQPFSVGQENLQLPEDLTLVDISTDRLRLEFDRRAKRYVKAEASVEGSPQEGYAVVEILIEPASIFISGPEMLLREIDVVESEPVDVNGKSKPLGASVRLVPPKGPGWKLIPDSVHIDVLIEKLLAVSYDSILVTVKDGAEGRRVSVSPELMKLTLSGPESKMKDLTATQFLVEIDLEALGEGAYSLPARIKLPEGINLISAIPKRFNVVIE